jgi:peptidoglycan/xylan/chitin deacetylase (PgdA/CDA1 family)/glycosyltransferase involved in cell wall biosynthesis
LRILHVLSQNELTGAEAYAVTLVRHQIEFGHEVLIVSDTCNLPLPEGARYHAIPIDCRGFLRRLKNVRTLKRLLREFRPQVVHAHSRAASWVARLATLNGPALVSTIHGRQHWHTRFKLNDIYGERIITICGNLKEHLIKDFGISEKKIDLIRNVVKVEEYTQSKNTPPRDHPRIGLFGRTSGPKGRIWGMMIRDVLPDLMEEFPNLEILMGGGNRDRLSETDQKSLDAFLLKYPKRASFFGVSPHLSKEIAEVDYVVAAGRIAIEALYGGRSVFGFGEHHPVGWITRSSLRNSLLSNFGDVGVNRDGESWWDPKELWVQIRAALLGQIHFDIVPEDLARYFGEKETYRQVDSAYLQAILKKKYCFGIPSLMFHKVVQGNFESRHKTYIQIDKFKNILKYLRWFGKNPVTFSDLIQACHGRRPFPSRPILLTFDDGYRDTLELAAPALVETKMRATLYLLADQTLLSNEWDTHSDPNESTSPLLSPSERRRLFETGAFEIGSHGLRHRSLSELPIGERDYEISESKRLLENEFGSEIHSFAYAFGTHSDEDALCVNRTGYQFAVGTDSHFGLEENNFRIFRANIFPEDGFLSTLKKSNTFYRHYFSAKRKIRSDRRNRAGLFSPSVARYRLAPLFGLSIAIFLGISVMRENRVNASPIKFRNVYGATLEACAPENFSENSIALFCRNKNSATTPTNICVEHTDPNRAIQLPKFECLSPKAWNLIRISGKSYRTNWAATNFKALSAILPEITRQYLD